ncbi:MAG: hypothetical protein RLZZ387_1005 [Chloroflexota bacterium]
MPDASQFTAAPLLSAEVHYFRLPRDDWELMLVRARQIGANTVSTYVPWSWHEPRPGALDLEGHTDPCRDLVGFVRLCGRLGLRVILKPGPFVDAELLGGGVPPWLLLGHPELHALRPDGLPWRHSDSGLPRACYLHPAYLEAARGWVRAFSRAALPLQAPGGPVVAVQVDNETPGDGMLPADIGLDPRLRLDYNPYVTDTLWPAWLARAGDEGAKSNAQEPRSTHNALASAEPSPLTPHASRPASHDSSLPRSFEPPRSLADLRRYALLDAFADWCCAEALATVASWLREDGWQVALFHDLLAAPWEAGGTIADAPGLARAVGWLGHNVYAEDVRDPFVGRGGYQLSFEEYIHFAYWRTRLVRSLSPGYPAFVPEISAAQDFFFAAPLLGGAQALNIYPLAQVQPDNPRAAAYPRWAMEAPVRPDGSVRRRLWNAKPLLTLLAAAGADFAASRSPAAVALGYSHVPERVGAWVSRPGYLRGGRAWNPEEPELREAAAGTDHGTRGQLLAQSLLRAGVSFDVVDLDSAAPEKLARHPLLLVPACGLLARATQRKLAGCGNLALVGDAHPRLDERLEPSSGLPDPPMRLPEDLDGTEVAELLEERGLAARHGWADAADVDVAVRYGPEHTYILVANRRPTAYSGTIAYRSPAGEVLHMHLSLGPLRVGAVMMRGDEVVGAAFGGDGSEGGWLARGMFSSVVFNTGAGAAAPCGAGLLLTAAQSGRFQLRRRDGWDDMVAYRLLLGGELTLASVQVEATHASVPYVAEDEQGCTDMYLLLPAASDVPPDLHGYLVTLLEARASMLLRLARGDTDSTFAQAATELEALAARSFKLEEYGVAWAASAEACGPPIEVLARDLASARGEYAAGLLDAAAYAERERSLSWALGIAARASLASDRE